MPPDRKYSHSEYRKAALYVQVLKPTFPTYLEVIILTTIFFFGIVLACVQGMGGCTQATLYGKVMQRFLVVYLGIIHLIILSVPLVA